MIIAQFSFDVPFGKKAAALEATRAFRPVGDEIGFPRAVRTMIGSIGAPESRVVQQFEFESLEHLGTVWGKLDHPGMSAFVEAMAPHTVPGSHKWEVFRPVDG